MTFLRALLGVEEAMNLVFLFQSLQSPALFVVYKASISSSPQYDFILIPESLILCTILYLCNWMAPRNIRFMVSTTCRESWHCKQTKARKMRIGLWQTLNDVLGRRQRAIFIYDLIDIVENIRPIYYNTSIIGEINLYHKNMWFKIIL